MTGNGDTEIQFLLDQALRGDDAAYDCLIQASAHRLQVLTSRMLRNYPRLRRWEETGDVFQTAVVRLHRSLTDVKPRSARDYFGLAATYIRRTLIDLARKHYGPLGQGANHFSDPAATGQVRMVDQKQARNDEPATLENWACFHEAVEQLPEAERSVFELVWYNALPQTEIAELLGISIPTVKRRLRSARIHLAESCSHFENGASRE